MLISVFSCKESDYFLIYKAMYQKKLYLCEEIRLTNG